MTERQENIERNRLIWRRFCSGESQASIGASYGITQQAVSLIVERARGAIARRSREDYRQELSEQLNDLRRACQEIADSPPAPAYRGNEPIFMPGGDPVWDHGGRLAAVDRIVKIQERLSKLLGLDEPQKVESDATVRYVVEGVNTENLS